MSRTRYHCLIALTLGLMSLFPTSIHANLFTIDLDANIKKPQITVTVKDKNGNDVDIKALVDTGNDNGIAIKKSVAEQLGLTTSGSSSAQGVGGTATVDNTSFSGDKALRVKGVTTPSGQAQTTLSITGSGIILPDSPYDLIIGQDFLSTFVPTFDNEKAKLVLTARDQLQKKPSVQPKATPITPAKGTLYIDGINNSWDLGIKLASLTGDQPYDFVLSTGFEHSLLSEDTAKSLGLDITSLTQQSLLTPFGLISAWITPLIQYNLFPTDPYFFTSFNVIPDQYNPGNINVLGMDILSKESIFQVDVEDRYLRAVPEPGTISFVFGGLILLLVLKSCAKRQVSVPRPFQPNRDMST